MLRISNIKIPVTLGDEALNNVIKTKYKIREIKDLKIVKKSIDARRKDSVFYVYSVDVSTDDDEKYIGKNISKAEYQKYEPVSYSGRIKKAVVVGAGPAGLMCALMLCRAGIKAILLERGKSVDERKADTENFFKSRVLDENSNVQFGEGGAGTFSDGKLTTGINDFRIGKVLEEFYSHGAPSEILYMSKPHIGTDNLCNMVRNLREDIIANGGEVRFSHKVTDLIIKDNKVIGVEAENNGKKYIVDTDTVVVATGHSARDLFEMLKRHNIPMERKPFSVGVRIEHSQEMINKSQYGEFAKYLGAADYKMAVHLESGRSVYTFCMCPGGRVIASSSEKGGVVTNGMSLYERDGKNANSAVLVSVTPRDFDSDDVLAGVYFQREIEKKAFVAGGKNYNAPYQTVGEFLGMEKTQGITPTYLPGVTKADFFDIFPEFVINSIKEALPKFDKKLSGFARGDSVLTAPETRSSSPVRILRDKETLMSKISGLYPCGEGAGYAGGITSAAVDGIKVAEKIIGF